MSALDKIASNQDQYSCKVDTLGECKIVSPVHHHEFIREGERIFVSEEEAYMKEMEKKLGHLPTFERAGPLPKIFHDPNWTRVGIVTAGGLCPGLNNVIKGLVEILSFDYGVKNIYGIRFGYAGLNPTFGYQPVMLNPDTVDTIHELGGTILGSSRGQQPTDIIVDTLVRMNINILFCVGGDGSLRCAREVAEECMKRNLKISVIGIPKTIDNDLQFVGRSFGFETAVAEAANVIRNAHVEAKGTSGGIGLVKLMGRDSGFIAAYASTANPVVNFCLVPEMAFELEGERGLLTALENRLFGPVCCIRFHFCVSSVYVFLFFNPCIAFSLESSVGGQAKRRAKESPLDAPWWHSPYACRVRIRHKAFLPRPLIDLSLPWQESMPPLSTGKAHRPLLREPPSSEIRARYFRPQARDSVGFSALLPRDSSQA